MTNGKNSIPFGTKYIVEGPREGLWIGNKNRASVGSHFALMALKQGTIYKGSGGNNTPPSGRSQNQQ